MTSLPFPRYSVVCSNSPRRKPSLQHKQYNSSTPLSLSLSRLSLFPLSPQSYAPLQKVALYLFLDALHALDHLGTHHRRRLAGDVGLALRHVPLLQNGVDRLEQIRRRAAQVVLRRRLQVLGLRNPGPLIGRQGLTTIPQCTSTGHVHWVHNLIVLYQHTINMQ